MENKEIKICKLCQQKIDITKDNYCCLQDYVRGTFSTEGFYHTFCFVQNIKGHNKTMTKAKSILDKAAKMIGIEEEEVIQI